MAYPDSSEKMACLRCGREMEYDWMTCPECGWRADGPWEDEDEIPTGGADRHTTGLAGSWVKWAAWILILVLAVLVLMGLF